MSIRSLVASIAVALASVAAARAETSSEAYIGGGYTDNLGRVSSGEQGEPLFLAGGKFGWRRQGTRVDGNVALGLDWYKYGGSLFKDELLGYGIADIGLGLIPDRIVWVVTDNFGQTASDPLEPSTPLNRQNVNVLSTGPDLKARLGGATTLMLSGRYDDVRYEVSPTDYTGWSAFATLGRELSTVSAIDLVAGGEHVDYQQGVLPNYDLQQAYLKYVASGSRTKLDLWLGWSQIKQNSEREDEPLAHLALSRKISAKSTLTVSAQHGLATGGEIFRSLQPPQLGTLPNQTYATVGDAALQTLVTATWNTAWQRTTLDAGLNFGKERYITAINNDVDRRGGNLTLTHAFTPKFTAGVFFVRDRREYTSLARVFYDTTVSVTAEQKLGRSFSLVLDLAHNDRDDSLDIAGYKENVGFLRLKWARAE